MDQDEDTFIRANGANDEDNDQLHFYTASGDTINVPHLRAVMDGREDVERENVFVFVFVFEIVVVLRRWRVEEER